MKRSIFNKGFLLATIAIALAAVSAVVALNLNLRFAQIRSSSSSTDGKVDTLISRLIDLEGEVENVEGMSELVDLALGSYQPSGGNVYKLANSVTPSQATITLTSFKEPISEIKYTMSILGSTIQYGTLDPRNPNKSEFVSFTGITQNADGTATLTGVVRGLPRSNVVTGGCTASTTLQLSHGGQSEFILSNHPCQLAEYPLKNFDDTITGYWNIPTPLSNLNPVTKAYVDSLVNGGAVSNARVTVPGTAGETVATGTIVYLKTSDGLWYKAGTGIAEASSTPLGISQGNGTVGVAIADGVLVGGLDLGQSGLTIGANYFLGATAGTLSTATSTREIGKARSATTLYVDFGYNAPRLLGANTYLGSNVFATSTASSTIIGAFPAWNIGKYTQVITTTGTSTFSVPSGITRVRVTLCGGGGGSGESTGNGPTGGAGGCAIKGVEVSGTSTITVFVGSGGAGGSGGGPGPGGTGTWTTFGVNGYYFHATGGSGGTGGTGAGGAGGTGVNGEINFTGGAGAGGFSATGLAGTGGQQGGGNMFGDGSYGAGGDGILNNNGNAGNQGVIIIQW